VLGAQRLPRPGTQGRPPVATHALTLPAILAIEDARAPTIDDERVLVQATESHSDPIRNAAIRALGRLERREFISNLLPLLTPASTRAEAANALVQALRGPVPDGVSVGVQEQAVLDALLAAGASEMGSKAPFTLIAITRSIGRLPYTNAAQMASAEAFLRRVLETPFPLLNDEPHVGALRGLESLARLNRKTHRVEEDTITRLRTIARQVDPKRAEVLRNAVAALIAVQGVDHVTIQSIARAQDMEVRRLTVLALSGAGSGASVTEDERRKFIEDFLTDSAPMVRIEAVRAWARRGAAEHGCGPLMQRLEDRNLHVVLVAIDALGDTCHDDPNVTDRLTVEARTAPVLAGWQREAHALVALAKRAPDRAALRLPHFAAHTKWQVRLYAARAAALIKDEQVLARLAEDPEDSVAEAALLPLRRLTGSESDGVFVAALNRRNQKVGRHEVRPYQVLRAAAIALEQAKSTPALVGAIADALARISLEQCETSRDVRLALIARLAELGSPDQASMLMALLKDLDRVVARAAATTIAAWTAKTVYVEPPLLVLPAPPSIDDLLKPASVLVEMDSGGKFEIRFNQHAPLARVRFLRLVSQGYYDDLTFHRIAPNFVIQGGSPNANEYCGACPFARDELGLAMNRRGTIGISTRGRDTGDSQIFINLVDNPRLDHEYTVFASVCQDATNDGMDVVDSIQEGDRMLRLRVITPDGSCK
jgi:cyclophilin family peptidyl-prolyl cis-trans isomerase/HEAT repeat protein